MTNHTMDHMHSEGIDPDRTSWPGQCVDPFGENRPPTCGIHNQMMIGERTIYLSHLPMFMFNPAHHEHNLQVILEVRLNGPGHAQGIYTLDRRKHPQERMYTMSPDPFELIELDPQHPARTGLTGDVFRGHLERGGNVIIPRAEAQIVNIVYFHAFDRNAEPLDELEYLLFGKAPDLFLAHLITRPPDFDQILGVTIGDTALAADDLARGIRIKIPGRANEPRTRIKAGERISGQVQSPGAEAGQPLDLQLEAGTEFYFEEGKLRLPMTMAPTLEEKVAGF